MSSSYSILLVESDTLLREMISDVLALHREGLRVVAPQAAADAHDILSAHPIDLVISDGTSESGTGQLFRDYVLDAWPEMPVILLMDPDILTKREHTPSLAVLERPPELDLLLKKVDELLAARKDSILHGIGLSSFLQMLHHDHSSCTLAVSSGNQTGHLFIREGKLIHASALRQEGRDAFFTIMGWPESTVRVIPRCHARVTIQETLTSLLLDWSLVVDNRNTEHLWTRSN